MPDYVLAIEHEDGYTKFYHGILSIEFYESSIRVKDSDDVIMSMDIRHKKSVSIYSVCPPDDSAALPTMSKED